MHSIFIESDHIYQSRNAEWALNSDSVIVENVEYRKYDPKFELIRRLGFSPQTFMINVIFAFSFNMLYTGIYVLSSVTTTPWFDILFSPFAALSNYNL